MQNWEEKHKISFHIPARSMYAGLSVMMSATYSQLIKTKNKKQKKPLSVCLIYLSTYSVREKTKVVKCSQSSYEKVFRMLLV